MARTQNTATATRNSGPRIMKRKPFQAWKLVSEVLLSPPALATGVNHGRNSASRPSTPATTAAQPNIGAFTGAGAGWADGGGGGAYGLLTEFLSRGAPPDWTRHGF